MSPFDSSLVRSRLASLWALEAAFGIERGSNRTYMEEIISDRMQFMRGLQILRDELQFADGRAKSDMAACMADFTVPSVLTTLAFTTCGDRVHQGEVEHYRQVIASRFANISEIGALKCEQFFPTGGGTDDGATLAHVTAAHKADGGIRTRVYGGNSQSFMLCAIDIQTHVGRVEQPDGIRFGITQESPFREARTACGAVIGALKSYTDENLVHRRIRRDIGEDNYALITGKGVRTEDGVDISTVAAAALVAIRGMMVTARALATELDDRGVGHLTASVTVNRVGQADTSLYVRRATVFQGEVRSQGLGLDAKKYGGTFVVHRGDKRLRMTENGHDGSTLPVEVEKIEVKPAAAH